MNYPVRTLIIEDGLGDAGGAQPPLVRRFQQNFPGARIIVGGRSLEGGSSYAGGSAHNAKDEGREDSRPGPRTSVRLIRHSGSFIKQFPNHPWYGNSGCDYSLILGYNCFCSCTYCFIQTIFEDRTPTLYVNTASLVEELSAFLENNPAAWISTGEYLDSFQLDDVTRTNEILIDVFKRYPMSTLELRTKIDNVAHLPDDPPGGILVTYSINPPEVIKRLEPGTATFERRLQMAGSLFSKGYRVALRIDPIIPTPSLAPSYGELPTLIQDHLGWEKVERIFIGVLRFDEALLTRMSTMPSSTFLLDAEYIRCPDGNYRPPKHERTAIYRSISRAIREHAPRIPISITMEPGYVRSAVLGDL